MDNTPADVGAIIGQEKQRKLDEPVDPKPAKVEADSAAKDWIPPELDAMFAT